MRRQLRTVAKCTGVAAAIQCQLSPRGKATPGQLQALSAELYPEQLTLSEGVLRLLQELNNDSVVAADAGKQAGFAIVS